MLVYSSVHLSATDINQISTQSQSKKGKVKLLYWSLGGVLISLPKAMHEPVCGNTTIVCDAWPVRRQTYGYLPSHKASPPKYQIILLDDRGTLCVNNLPRVALDSGEARIQTRDLLIASPAS